MKLNAHIYFTNFTLIIMYLLVRNVKRVSLAHIVLIIALIRLKDNYGPGLRNKYIELELV